MTGSYFRGAAATIRVYQTRGEQFLLIKSPPVSGKSRALMYVALDKLANQGSRSLNIYRA